jgi:hypothetical protein
MMKRGFNVRRLKAPEARLGSIRHARTGRGDRSRRVVALSLPAAGFFPASARERRLHGVRFKALRLTDSIQAPSPRSNLSLARIEARLAADSETGSKLLAYFFDSIPNCSPARSAFRSLPRADSQRGADQRSSPLPVPKSEIPGLTG